MDNIEKMTTDEAIHILKNAIHRSYRLEEALKAIVEWKLPKTGKFWPNEDGTDSDVPTSFEFEYGSNGVREYFRNLAREALKYHE